MDDRNLNGLILEEQYLFSCEMVYGYSVFGAYLCHEL